MLREWVLLLLGALLSRAELLPIRAYNTSDGLAEDRINAIVPDSRGFLWFATTGGLSRFDGHRFTTWQQSGGALAIQSPSSLIAAPGGEYWLGVRNGLVRFGKDGPRHAISLLPDASPHAIATMVRTRSGRLFAATGLVLYEVAAGRLHPVPLALGPGNGTRIAFLAEDRAAQLWVAAPPYIHILNPDALADPVAMRIRLPAPVTAVNAFIEPEPGAVWLGTNAGLLRYRFDPASGLWTLRHSYGVREGLAGPEVTSLLDASDRFIWAGTTRGISRFPERNEIPAFTNLKAPLLIDTAVSALAEDAAGNVWAGTDSAGVMRIQPHGFTTYQEDDGLKSPALLQVLQDRDDTVVGLGEAAGATTRILSFFDGKAFSQGKPRALGERGAWGWQSLLIRSRAGDWWAATRSGLCRFPSVPAPALLRILPQACYTGESIFHLFEDSHGNIWASAGGDYLLRWNRDTDRVAYVQADGTESAARAVFGDFVSAMSEDRAGGVWLGLWNGGLIRHSHGHLTRLAKTEAPAGSVLSLYTDSAGRLWVAASSGLSVFDSPSAPQPRFRTWDTSKGMSSNSVRTIVEDGFGDIWAGTAQGVVRLDPRTGSIRRFNSGDGLPQAVFRSSIRDRAGNLWFATSRGLARIAPKPEAGSRPPTVLLTGIQIADEAYPVSLLGEERIAGAVLGPSQNHVRIEFAAPRGSSAEDIRYRVMLSGADSAWSGPRPDPAADYRNLPAGQYHFLVKSVDLAGDESAPAGFAFRILPPVWLRWWFEMAAAFAICGFAWGLHSYRLAHVVAVERMRTAIATDLHDEIGASLARIAIVSEVARVNLERGHEFTSSPLEKIAAMARELLDSLNDIAWAVRSSDSSVESLISRMREFGLDVLSTTPAGFTLVCDENLRGRQLQPDMRREILLIFKECLHNIAKHSGCRSARAEMKLSHGKLILTVSDDGRGDACQPPQSSNGRTPFRGNGIPGIIRRACAMGGEVEYGSRPEGGFQVTLLIPDPPRRCFW